MSKQRYLDLVWDLRSRRAQRGSLPQREEADLMAGLELVWETLTTEDQAEVEMILSAPESLGMVDRAVNIGDRVLPREEG